MGDAESDIRGEIISYTAARNKARKSKQEQLIDSILDLDRRHSASPSPELYKDRLDLQMQYNLISTQETEQFLLRSRGFIYEHGEKAGCLLAHQLKCRSAAQLIPQIQKSSDELTVDPVEINNTFETVYSNLYTSEFPEDDTDMLNFLDNLDAPSINPDKRTDLDKPITFNEIISSISAMQSGKAPGPDGYPVEFNKRFSSKLAPLLLKKCLIIHWIREPCHRPSRKLILHFC